VKFEVIANFFNKIKQKYHRFYRHRLFFFAEKKNIFNQALNLLLILSENGIIRTV
jgi:ABC-type long-subunit fatty acid transport system fused permease/ATPase subunit